MNEQDNIKTVQQIYAAFGQGNIPAILGQLTADVAWVNAGPESVPYARRRQGVDAVQSFFASLGANVEVQSFEPKEFFASGDRVVVLGAWTARAKPTGKSFASDWAMAWTLRDGKVTSFQSYEDTHAVAAAFSA
ncbi:nuclear transport factor 2 family protein [Variovorax sp. J22R133]|uniref:nuclear transport factor 2 family protein n=1 Tax=Variovorax brevis TaxID=3053503 RepID=UPI0025760739|nr:nuclear transport factor 2 family protein [Variovorax sp. J22R133]MDM0114378.1 nuclear transport factor 2 family protein [Variovorax sp. J22R133]